MRTEIPADPRHDLRPQRDRRPGDHDPPRPAGRLPGAARRRDPGRRGRQRAEIVATLVGILGLGATPRPTRCASSSTPARPTSSSPGASRRPVERRPRGDRRRRDLAQVRLEPEAVRVYPLEGGAPKTTLAAHLLGFVEPRGRRPVRGRGPLAGDPRRRAAGARSPSATRRASRTSRRPTALEAGSPGADVTLTIDASLQLAVEHEVYAAWVADRAKSVSGGRHGPGERRDPRRGDLPCPTTPTATQAVAAASPEPVPGPGRLRGLRAGLGLQDGHRRRGHRGGRRDADVRACSDQAILRLDGGKAFVTNADKGSKGEPDVPGRRGLVAQRGDVQGRAQASARPPQAAAEVLYAIVDEARLRRPDRRSMWPARSPGIVRDPARSPGARSTSPTARSARAWP